MKPYQLSFQRWMQVLSVCLLVLVAFSSVGYAAPVLQGQQNPSITVLAPAAVEIGERIELQLVVEHAQNVAGYEAQLLFDPAAAHFSGLHQRDSELKQFGRDVIPLEATELPDGIAMGLASCNFADCVQPGGTAQLYGAAGRVRLATVLVGTDQAGTLELALANVKLVDAQGNLLAVDIPAPKITVQVGAANGAMFTAPGSSWQRWAASRAARSADVTGDGRVNYFDAAEAALAWKLSRELGQPCGPANGLSQDVNGDGCIDIADIQLILAGQPAEGAAFPEAASVGAGPAAIAAALTFTVNSTGDQGDANIGDGVCDSGSGCTLRAAIQEANKHLGPDTIEFNIPGSEVQTIQLESALPSLADGSGGTTIDGYSQPGAQANTDSLASNAVIKVQIRGNGATNFYALQVQSAGNTIQGLAFFNARRSLWVLGSAATGNIIAGNFIGTDAAGSFVAPAHAYTASGVTVEMGASNNRIGGTSPAERNIISGNALHGIDFHSEATNNNVVINNLIGLNPSGTGQLLNHGHGLDINSGPAHNVIGGLEAGERNIISGNGSIHDDTFNAGVEISHDPLTSYNQVIGNCIGTDPSCNSAPPWASNNHYNVRLEDGVNNNTIAGNVIVNGLRGGIRISGSGTDHNLIDGNRVGVTLNDTPVPSTSFGISIATPSKANRVGPNNIIAHSLVGVLIIDNETDQHTITQNSIYNNSRAGIDLGPRLGVTPNDIGDVDTGPNQGLNFPVLTNATTSGVTGTACAEAVVEKPCTIEIFIAERNASDSGGGNYGQGKTFVGSGTSAPDGSFTINISGVALGQYLTSTATDASGNTSEFSLNILVEDSGPIPTPTTGPGPTATLNPTPTSGPGPTATPTLDPGDSPTPTPTPDPDPDPGDNVLYFPVMTSGTNAP